MKTKDFSLSKKVKDTGLELEYEKFEYAVLVIDFNSMEKSILEFNSTRDLEETYCTEKGYFPEFEMFDIGESEERNDALYVRIG